MSAAATNRKLHRWGSIIGAIPLLVIIVTGLILQLKKDVAWIQPPTVSGAKVAPTISFDRVLEITSGVEEMAVESWNDIDRLDVRPGKGMLKVRGENRWELQIDTSTEEILSLSYRRSDLIEAIHDGSWFHDSAKLWVFLPAAIILCGLWFTGIYLWLLPHLVKRRRKKKA